MLNPQNQVFLFKIETTEGTDAVPAAAVNAIATGLIMPNYSFQELQRLAIRAGLSEVKKLIGQETIEFDVPIEVKGGGTPTTVPEFGPLLEVCALTKADVAAKTVKPVEKVFGNSNLPAILVVASGGSYTPTVPKRFVVKVTTGGASGAAKVSVSCLDDAGVLENTVDNTVTTATPIDLGTSGGTITFTFASGNLVLNDSWIVYCQVPGTSYKSRISSEALPSGTAYLYIDGLLWKVVAVRGDLSVNLNAGELGEFRFKLKGKLGGISDAAVPTDAVYQDSFEPVQVENAGSVINANKTLVISSITMETGNNLQVRKNVNASKGIQGYRPGKRASRFGLNLEAELEATHPFWGDLQARKEFPINGSVGSVGGNIVDFFIRRAAFGQNSAQNNSELLNYQLGGQCLSGPLGDRNIEIFTR